MTGGEIALIITAAGTLVTAFGVAFVGIYAAVIAGRVKTQGEVAAKTLIVAEATHASTNSKMTQLTEEVRTAAKAMGVKEGRAEMAEAIAATSVKP